MRLLLILAILAAATPAAAQSLDPVQVDRRVSRLESEMRAVQRKVFPGGDPRFFDPELPPPGAAAPPPADTVAANQPLVDLTARVDEMERQLRTLTGQVEAQGFRLKQLEAAQTKLRGDLEFRLSALEGGVPGGVPGAAPATVPPAAGAIVPPAAGSAGPATATTRPAAMPPKVAGTPTTVPKPASMPAAGAKPTGAATPGPTGTASPTGTTPPAAPGKAVNAPTTADAAWKAAYARVLAKNWPATQIAMTDFIAAWPKSTRLPQAQYWLGRSHAERSEHAPAARAFLDVYQTYPRSDQAPGALLGLATAMQGLKKPADACRVLGEMDSVYGARLTPSQQTDAKALRAKAKCPA